MMKKLYRCEACFAYYENKQRANKCHNMKCNEFITRGFKRVTCNNYRHYYTDKETGERLSYCFYCGGKKDGN